MTDHRKDTVPGFAVKACPQCGGFLTPQGVGTAFTCKTKGCGEWVPAGQLRALVVAENVGEVVSFDGFGNAIVRCPDCQREMDAWNWSNAVFRRCAKHGAWLETWSRSRFYQLLAQDDERERVIRTLADSLATEGGRLELARRLLMLERRVTELEKK